MSNENHNYEEFDRLTHETILDGKSVLWERAIATDLNRIANAEERKADAAERSANALKKLASCVVEPDSKHPHWPGVFYIDSGAS
jgi:hypothetical protein